MGFPSWKGRVDDSPGTQSDRVGRSGGDVGCGGAVAAFVRLRELGQSCEEGLSVPVFSVGVFSAGVDVETRGVMRIVARLAAEPRVIARGIPRRRLLTLALDLRACASAFSRTHCSGVRRRVMS